MNYCKSQIDNDNFNWFRSDNSRNSLRKIKIANGRIRGVAPIEMSFDYPITAIVGENGSGKSTVLALVTCAFHNASDFFPQNRIRLNVKKPRNYYTYGDFSLFLGMKQVLVEWKYLQLICLAKD